MSQAATPIPDATPDVVEPRRLRLGPGVLGLVVLLTIALPCIVTLPWSLKYYDAQDFSPGAALARPSRQHLLGTDSLGRPMLWRCLLGGAISLGIGLSAAAVSVVIGVIWGSVAGYLGGRTDALMMRFVDVMYGLPYILLVVLVNIAARPLFVSMAHWVLPSETAPLAGDVITLLIAIGAVSWLTMARVIRGQVLSLRAQPFTEAARALGFGPGRILIRHLLPNMVGPIVVYATLTVPAAILQESFLSFLGIGVRAPLPSWGNLAANGMGELAALNFAPSTIRWWLLFWPCVLLGLTLLALNFLGDALQARLDPRSRKGGA